MRASGQCIRLITGFEKFRPTAYKPTPHDIWTCGYGHTKGVKEGDTCDMAQAIEWLHDDAHEAEDAINRHDTVPLTQNQFDALVSFVFNIGNGAFIESTLLRKLNDGQFEAAAAEFQKWNHQAGRVLDGLTVRRAAERKLFETPQ